MTKDKHLIELEKESIALIREVISTCNLKDTWCFYSMGKDSSCLLRLIEKAFYPNPIGINFLHIDTGYKFKEMYQFRDKISKTINLKVFKNPKSLNPYNDLNYTDVMKTEALTMAIEKHNIKIAFGGSRREEEKSRAKERMVSTRKQNKWNPRSQNSEVNGLWNTFYNDDITLRVFPMSNWTELDIWEYIKAEKIDIVPLYFSHNRNVEVKDDQLIPTESSLGDNKLVRFRTLGCYPLTAAIESKAMDEDDIINELKESKYSERVGRLIDKQSEFSMEKKKINGYF